MAIPFKSTINAGNIILNKTSMNSKPLVIQSGGVTTTIGDKDGAWTLLTSTAKTNGFGFEGHINAMTGYSIYSTDNGEVAYKKDLPIIVNSVDELPLDADEGKIGIIQ